MGSRPQQPLAKISARHDLLALYLAAGRKPAVACKLAGFSHKYYVQHLRMDPKIQALVAEHKEEIMERRKAAIVEDELRATIDTGAVDAALELGKIVNNHKTFKADKIAAGRVLIGAATDMRRNEGGSGGGGVVINIGGPKLETLERLDPDNDPDWRENSIEVEEEDSGEHESGG